MFDLRRWQATAPRSHCCHDDDTPDDVDRQCSKSHPTSASTVALLPKGTRNHWITVGHPKMTVTAEPCRLASRQTLPQS